MTAPVISRGIRYTIEVIGGSSVEKELAKTDRALDGLRESVEQTDKAVEGVNDALREQPKAAAAAGKGATGLRRDMDKAADTADRLSQSLGKVAGGLAAAAAAFSASALLELAEEGSGFEVISRRLDEIGVSAEQVSEIGSRLGGGATSAIERLISVASAGGIAFEQMGAMADAALQLATARGLDSHDVMKELTKAVTAGEVGWLRQQGVIINVASAQREYAESINKTTAELTEQDKVAAASNAVIRELNEAFAGKPPDKYASNIGAVRDKLDNLADLIKRKLADALNDLGAALSGGAFASDPVKSRLTQTQEQIGLLEELERQFEEAGSSPALRRRVFEGAIEKFGEDDFRRMLGLPSDTQLNRFTLGYLDGLGTVRDALEAARDREARLIANEVFDDAGDSEPDEPDEPQAVKRAVEQFKSVSMHELGATMAQEFYAGLLETEPDSATSPEVGMYELGRMMAEEFERGLAEAEAADPLHQYAEALAGMMALAQDMPTAMAPAVDALGAFGRQMAQNIVTAALYGESFRELAAQALEGLAVQAGGEAIFQSAKGLAALGLSVFYPPAAAAAQFHFASAGAFLGIAAAAGVGAKAAGGFNGSAGGAGAGAPGPASGPPAPSAPGSTGPQQTTVVIDFRNRPLTTKREIEMGVAEALHGAGGRAGRQRFNPRRMAGGR